MSTFTPKRALTRPRPSLSSGVNTASSPSLAASYNALQSPSLNSLRTSGILGRKASLSALTQGSLATIPDASEGYGLSTVLDEDSPTIGRMAPHTPAGADYGDIEVGDLVDVPGNMHGTVKFVGNVHGKKGSFAGVELSEEFASRGKNNGVVDGISYFTTSIDGAGIFLPVARATRRVSPPTSTSSFPLTPTTPSVGGVKIAGPISYTPPTPSLPKFSQSVGPGRAPSPQFKKSRPSLPRPESPLRKPQLAAPAARPSIGTPQPKGSVRYAPSPTPAKFGQSLRGTRDAGDPSKKGAYTAKSGLKASMGPRSISALGQNPMSFSDEETTPIGTARTTNNSSLGSVSSFNAKMRPAELRSNEEEVARLRGQLEERDKQLKEQASSLAEMESSLAEVQCLMGGSDTGSRNNRNSIEDKDATQLRALLREKNEKIAMLTAEFDAHRADFRSTIDTLELASTETERVYEKRVEDLLQEIRDYQDRNEDVDSVARQLKQLEELVQELEEGLEDARRGEAEARGEVEFLRGEVERGRSELRREREKATAMLNGPIQGLNGESTAKEVEQRDDEIRGLKAIIHSLSRDAVPDSQDPQKTPTQRNGSFPRTRRTSQQSADERYAREKLERELAELRTVVETKTNREEELERELEHLRRGSATVSISNQRTSAMTIGSNGTTVHERSSIRDSKGTVVSWRDRDAVRSPEQHRRGNTLETMPESDTYSSATDGSALWCEICETGGHDILTCTNMFGSKQGHTNGSGDYATPAPIPSQQRTGRDVVREGLKGLSPKIPGGEYTPAPLSPLKKPSPRPSPVGIMSNPMDQGPVAGKESGVVDVNKWCALCERDGHESVDCPFENVI